MAAVLPLPPAKTALHVTDSVDGRAALLSSRRQTRTCPARTVREVRQAATWRIGAVGPALVKFLRTCSGPTRSSHAQLPLPVTAAGPQLDPAPRLQPGKWACRWSLAGRVLAVKQFRIG